MTDEAMIKSYKEDLSTLGIDAITATIEFNAENCLSDKQYELSRGRYFYLTVNCIDCMVAKLYKLYTQGSASNNTLIRGKLVIRNIKNSSFHLSFTINNTKTNKSIILHTGWYVDDSGMLTDNELMDKILNDFGGGLKDESGKVIFGTLHYCYSYIADEILK